MIPIEVVAVLLDLYLGKCRPSLVRARTPQGKEDHDSQEKGGGYIRSSQHHSVRLLPHFDCYLLGLLGCYPRESLVPPAFRLESTAPKPGSLQWY